jgi:hypothetical protein
MPNANATVEQADCLDWLRRQPVGSLDLLLSSPPYENARLYLEDGQDLGIARDTEAWVAWMVKVVEASLVACKGLVAFVVQGPTRNYRWSCGPAYLMADLGRRGINLRSPLLYKRSGIPGSGRPDWLRHDYEWIVCATAPGRLPWSDPTALGKPPKYDTERHFSARRANGQRANETYAPPDLVNPGDVIDCRAVGGGNMGHPLCHENEAPFAEQLAEFMIRTFCPPGGLVGDCFAGSGTTLAVAVACGRRAVGCDLRASQVELTRRRLLGVQLPLWSGEPDTASGD